MPYHQKLQTNILLVWSLSTFIIVLKRSIVVMTLSSILNMYQVSLESDAIIFVEIHSSSELVLYYIQTSMG